MARVTLHAAAVLVRGSGRTHRTRHATATVTVDGTRRARGPRRASEGVTPAHDRPARGDGTSRRGVAPPVTVTVDGSARQVRGGETSAADAAGRGSGTRTRVEVTGEEGVDVHGRPARSTAARDRHDASDGAR
eukprot:jgi/Mesvir1/5737/Mv03804-RA.1